MNSPIDAPAARESLEQRIRNKAEGDSVRASRHRKQVCFARFLERVKAHDPDGTWSLKGGFAIQNRYASLNRSTLDVDLASSKNSVDEIEQTLRAIAAVDLGDHFNFSIRRNTSALSEEGDPSVRFSVTAEMAGREFETFPVDIAIGLGPESAPEQLPVDDGFSATFDFPVIPIEKHAAEKVHAYTRRYGQEGLRSTRAKDLVDLALLIEDPTFDDQRFTSEIRETFRRRGTHAIPSQLETPPSEWEPQFESLATEIGLEVTMSDAFVAVAGRIDPLLA